MNCEQTKWSFVTIFLVVIFMFSVVSQQQRMEKMKKKGLVKIRNETTMKKHYKKNFVKTNMHLNNSNKSANYNIHF